MKKYIILLIVVLPLLASCKGTLGGFVNERSSEDKILYRSYVPSKVEISKEIIKTNLEAQKLGVLYPAGVMLDKAGKPILAASSLVDSITGNNVSALQTIFGTFPFLWDGINEALQTMKDVTSDTVVTEVYHQKGMKNVRLRNGKVVYKAEFETNEPTKNNT